MGEREKIARDILEEACETNEIFEDCDMDLLDTGYLDSFALLSIILEIEKRMGIKLQATDVKRENVCSVNAFVKFLETL